MYSCFSTSSSVEAKIFENPMMAFRGVRISWLILARKADLRRLDSSARSLADNSSFCIIFLSVMTNEEPTSVSGLFCSSLVSTAACASTQSIFLPAFPLFSTRYSSFTLLIFPSIKSWKACMTLGRSSLSILEKYCSSDTLNCSSLMSPDMAVIRTGRLISHRMECSFRFHFQGMILAISKAMDNLWLVELNICCALCSSVLSRQKMSTVSSSIDGLSTIS